MVKRVGLGFLAFMCGTMFLAGVSTFLDNLFTNPARAMSDLAVTAVFGALTVFIILKLFGRRIRVIPETRKYLPGSKLPIVPNAGLVLMPGEVCHIAEKAQAGVLKTVTGSVRRSSGTRVRGLLGTSYSGASRSRSTSEDVIDRSSGMLYVTNKRIVIAAPKYGFEAPLRTGNVCDTVCKQLRSPNEARKLYDFCARTCLYIKCFTGRSILESTWSDPLKKQKPALGNRRRAKSHALTILNMKKTAPGVTSTGDGSRRSDKIATPITSPILSHFIGGMQP